jgi:hypothetical protein
MVMYMASNNSPAHQSVRCVQLLQSTKVSSNISAVELRLFLGLILSRDHSHFDCYAMEEV